MNSLALLMMLVTPIRVDVDLGVRSLFQSDQQVIQWTQAVVSDMNISYAPASIQLAPTVELLDVQYSGNRVEKLERYRLDTLGVAGIRLLLSTSPFNFPTGAGVATEDGWCLGEPVAVVEVPVVEEIREHRAVELAVHETGHLFGLKHSHCEQPPLDMCWSGPSSCYQGPTSCPVEEASVMSLCYNGACAPQLNSKRFHQVQIDQLRSLQCVLFSNSFE